LINFNKEKFREYGDGYYGIRQAVKTYDTYLERGSWSVNKNDKTELILVGDLGWLVDTLRISNKNK
jgi:hypothetical protein